MNSAGRSPHPPTTVAVAASALCVALSARTWWPCALLAAVVWPAARRRWSPWGLVRIALIAAGAGGAAWWGGAAVTPEDALPGAVTAAARVVAAVGIASWMLQQVTLWDVLAVVARGPLAPWGELTALTARYAAVLTQRWRRAHTAVRLRPAAPTWRHRLRCTGLLMAHTASCGMSQAHRAHLAWCARGAPPLWSAAQPTRRRSGGGAVAALCAAAVLCTVLQQVGP